MIGSTGVRIVCANTLAAAENPRLSRIFRVRHQIGAQVKIGIGLREITSEVKERFERLALELFALKQTFLEPSQFDRLVLDVVAPEPKTKPEHEDTRIQKLLEATWERAMLRRDLVRYAWHYGTGAAGDGSAYDAYNGTAEVMDHHPAFAIRRNGSRLASNLDGSMGAKKRKVLMGLRTLAGIAE
jgi:hypothetical protein